jgi:hypothetical protein
MGILVASAMDGGMSMTYIHRICIEFRIDDDGDKTAKVTSRKGSSGEYPPTEIEHDSHFLNDALGVLRRVAREARNSL